MVVEGGTKKTSSCTSKLVALSEPQLITIFVAWHGTMKKKPCPISPLTPKLHRKEDRKCFSTCKPTGRPCGPWRRCPRRRGCSRPTTHSVGGRRRRWGRGSGGCSTSASSAGIPSRRSSGWGPLGCSGSGWRWSSSGCQVRFMRRFKVRVSLRLLQEQEEKKASNGVFWKLGKKLLHSSPLEGWVSGDLGAWWVGLGMWKKNRRLRSTCAKIWTSDKRGEGGFFFTNSAVGCHLLSGRTLPSEMRVTWPGSKPILPD